MRGWLVAVGLVLVSALTLAGDEVVLPYLPGLKPFTAAASAEEIAERLAPYVVSRPTGFGYPDESVEICGMLNSVRVPAPQGVPSLRAVGLSRYRGGEVGADFWVMPDAERAAGFQRRVSAAARGECDWDGEQTLGDSWVQSRSAPMHYQRDGWSGVRVVETGHYKRGSLWSEPFTDVWVIARRGVTVAVIQWSIRSGLWGSPQPQWAVNGEHAADELLRLVGGRHELPPPAVADPTMPTSMLARAMPSVDDAPLPPWTGNRGADGWTQRCFGLTQRERLPDGMPVMSLTLRGTAEIRQLAAVFPDEPAAERYREALILPSDTTFYNHPCVHLPEIGPQPNAMPESVRPIMNNHWRGHLQTWAAQLPKGSPAGTVNAALAVRRGTVVVYIRAQGPDNGNPQAAMTTAVATVEHVLNRLPPP